MRRNINVFVLGICLASVYWALVSYRWSEMYHGWPVAGVGADHSIYWHVCNGDYQEWARGQWWYATTFTGPYGWLYKDSLVPVFYILTFAWLPLPIASRLWIACMVLVYSIILVKLLRTEHGWTVALLTLKPFLVTLQAGNIAPLLSLMATTAPGAILAGCIKPFALGFVVLMAVARTLEQKAHRQANTHRCDDIHSNSVADTPTPFAWLDSLGLVSRGGGISRNPMDKVTLRETPKEHTFRQG